ncbi:molybdate ABC transporter substrate-binding protein [Treponema phagedenis]|uniref:Molybdate ABC transporter substrate-binding protein n=1 Tax=Treponema phagedenis TaxID=162 RepID=A0A0B7GW14_TREPH|nr:molybdate ABC transporter substrate-binding protein [Treponema phagedenis]NVP24774.1 molybdate ABC transporter substrate-binding protein [Treponema phagedenis]QEJ95884.1 molybdate ABC transporter substrate-binding protein [Treponema phagedenis]QEJ98888.1 molybdate ABC transporter substrate-binding protein [Treponema phagedenis]QEK00418.1 molybdate ABC transporter substrate-binding protein [Treponema phagedenis]QEK05428.1 molybdate ABC transporter substrate-binding protein [Treponema phagede
MTRKILLTILTVIFLFTACNENKRTEEKEIFISAAASLTDAIKEIIDIYKKDNNIEILANFAGSGTLQAQIEENAPCDIFFSAADKQMNRLEEKNLIDKNSRFELLENEVVLITPKDSKTILTFKTIQDSDVKKIAIADPESVPVGAYSKEIFTKIGNFDFVKTKMVSSADVRQSLDWVVSGNVDCATVYKTDAFIEKDKINILDTAPEGTHSPVNYPIAIIKGSESKTEVQKFFAYLKSDDAKKVYEKYGFKVK